MWSALPAYSGPQPSTGGIRPSIRDARRPCGVLWKRMGNLGTEGRRRRRPPPGLDHPESNRLTTWISRLAQARRNSPPVPRLYRNVHLTNRQIIFERAVPGERVLVAINADSAPYTAHFDAGSGWRKISSPAPRTTSAAAVSCHPTAYPIGAPSADAADKKRRRTEQ